MRLRGQCQAVKLEWTPQMLRNGATEFHFKEATGTTYKDVQYS